MIITATSISAKSFETSSIFEEKTITVEKPTKGLLVKDLRNQLVDENIEKAIEDTLSSISKKLNIKPDQSLIDNIKKEKMSFVIYYKILKENLNLDNSTYYLAAQISLNVDAITDQILQKKEDQKSKRSVKFLILIDEAKGDLIKTDDFLLFKAELEKDLSKKLIDKGYISITRDDLPSTSYDNIGSLAAMAYKGDNNQAERILTLTGNNMLVIGKEKTFIKRKQDGKIEKMLTFHIISKNFGIDKTFTHKVETEYQDQLEGMQQLTDKLLDFALSDLETVINSLKPLT